MPLPGVPPLLDPSRHLHTRFSPLADAARTNSVRIVIYTGETEMSYSQVYSDVAQPQPAAYYTYQARPTPTYHANSSYPSPLSQPSMIPDPRPTDVPPSMYSQSSYGTGEYFGSAGYGNPWDRPSSAAQFHHHQHPSSQPSPHNPHPHQLPPIQLPPAEGQRPSTPLLPLRTVSTTPYGGYSYSYREPSASSSRHHASPPLPYDIAVSNDQSQPSGDMSESSPVTSGSRRVKRGLWRLMDAPDNNMGNPGYSIKVCTASRTPNPTIRT